MKNLFKLRKKTKNLTFFFQNLFPRYRNKNKLIYRGTSDLKFLIFSKRLPKFTLRGIIAKKHKQSINNSISICGYVSGVKVTMTYPSNYALVRIA